MAETVGLLVTENRRIGNVFSRKIRLDRTIVDLTSRDSVYKVQEPAIFIEHTLPVIDVLEGNPVIVGADAVYKVKKVPFSDKGLIFALVYFKQRIEEIPVIAQPDHNPGMTDFASVFPQRKVVFHISAPADTLNGGNIGKTQQCCHQHGISLTVASAAVENVNGERRNRCVIGNVSFDPAGNGSCLTGRRGKSLGDGITQFLQGFSVSIGKEPVCEAQVRILLPIDLVDVLPGSGSKLRCDLVAGIGSFQSRCFCAYRHQSQ